jgi:pyridinium-3,5-bisthiocarboxylic acid mononucleotide nickel chelatase
MRTLYFDCFSGISGDMTVGALRDLGVEESVFQEALAALQLGDEFHAHFRRDSRQNIVGWKFDVHTHDHQPADQPHSHAPHHGHEHGGHHHHHHDEGGHDHSHHDEGHTHGRNHREIRELIEASTLSDSVKDRVLSVFRRIAEAEGKIHGVPADDVGFHEVGAADSIADIVAACAGFEALDVERVFASKLVEGSGWIRCAHGRFPLPAPATLEILAGIPLSQIDESVEFITPTGAALLAEFADGFGTLPEMVIEKIGYGIGSRNSPNRPNVLRVVLGEAASLAEAETDEIAQIETNIDDLSPELAGATMESLFNAGALDVFFTSAQMKKNRPGFLLTVLADQERVNELIRIILTETSAFGVRVATKRRFKLRREFRDVETPYGTVRIKIGLLGDEIVQAAPEYESCREVARRAGVSVKDVHLAAWITSTPQPEKQ